MPVVLDNNKIGAIGEYIKENTKEGASMRLLKKCGYRITDYASPINL